MSNEPAAANPYALALDVAQLDRARSALARGETKSALEALDAYSATHRTGVLDREATILRIDAFVSQGDKARAVRLARRYLEQFPRDPHAQRLEQLVAEAKE
jgi:outer membrane protein assembly factor BamD (BamD/ComL family)